MDMFVMICYYSDVTMNAMESQITSLTIVYSTVCSGTDQRKHQNSASLAFVWGIRRWPVNSPHKGPVTRKMFLFDDVIMLCEVLVQATFCMFRWASLSFGMISMLKCKHAGVLLLIYCWKYAVTNQPFLTHWLACRVTFHVINQCWFNVKWTLGNILLETRN